VGKIIALDNNAKRDCNKTIALARLVNNNKYNNNNRSNTIVKLKKNNRTWKKAARVEKYKWRGH
jgi:hypothetical protein